MKREILFRGKKVDNGEWVEGGLVVAIDGACLIYASYDRKQTTEINGKPFYSVYAKNYEVIPESVGQFTGLLDKNGKKIFEDDILKYNSKKDYKAIVKWNDEEIASCGCCYSAFNGAGFLNEIIPGSRYTYSCFGSNFELAEIIGNVHDNKDLLEAK